MDGDLDASRPNWAENGASLQSPGRDTSSTLDATRPHWHGPNAGSLSQDPAPTATVQQQAQDDQERVVEAVDKAGRSMSRPIDFLKLVGLMEVVDSADDRVRTTLVVDVPLSMFAAAKTLGRGLSFEVQLIRVGKKVMENVQLRSEFVVYKKLRGLTDKLDKIEKGDLLRAALLEVRILTHPPLRTHPNIVDIIQLLWEPDPDHLDQAWPVIVLEYAENGTLADFQEDHPNIPFSLKTQLCRDVGNGLLALHASDIVHGDLKSENVLVCNTVLGGVVAKLADFGCAIADLEPSDTLKLPAFTMPWNAPECHDKLPRDLLKYTDIYSYGLLVWRVALNGANPFRLIDALSSLEKHQFHREVEALKLQERILPMARGTLHSQLYNTDVDLPLIREVLELTLQLDAVTRDLPSSVARFGGQGQQQHTMKQPLSPYEYESVDVVLPVSGMAPMCLLLSIIRELVTLSADPRDIGTQACYQLFQIYLARLDWPGARENAGRWFWNAVRRQESPLIAVYMRGTFEYLGQPVPKMDLEDVLKTYAAHGCPTALVELKQHFPSSFPAIQRYSQLLGGLMSREKNRAISDGVDLVNFEDFCNSLMTNRSETLDLSGFVVSENGDLLIHAAARIGCTQAIDKLLSSGIDIDAVNHAGETALLQACRAGCSEMVKCLLDRGANAVLAALNGETPLHWVLAFDNDQIESMTELLFSHGAMPCLYSDVNIGNSSAVEYLNLYGSPLNYAVLARHEAAAQALLSRGADPFFGCEHEFPDFLTPFSIAVAELLPKTIRLMIDPATNRKSFQRYLHSRKERVLEFLVRWSSSPFLAHWASLGATLVPSLIETLDIIRAFEGGGSISRKLNQKMSLLHACIIRGQPADVIEHLLKTGCSRDLEVTSDIREHTPLQAAIYLNRREVFLLLLKYGANIHRRLVLPEGISYLHYCAMVGIEGQYFANELVSRGARPKAVDAVVETTLTPGSSPPALMAMFAGNFELATWFASLEPLPTEIPLLSVLLGSPRMPVSRLRYLLEPPNGLQPADLQSNKVLNRSCFHALVKCTGGPELESIVNFRYLLQQAKARSQEHLINQVDVMGFTPLVGAALLGRLELVRELLAAGADPNCGSVTCTNAAILGLDRLRRAPSQVLDNQRGVTLTKKEFRHLEQDFLSIITLSRQYGSEEPTMLGAPKVDYNRLYNSGSKGILSFRKGWEDARLRRQAEHEFRARFAGEGSSVSTGSSAGDSRSEDRADTQEKSLKDKLLGSTGYAKRLLERVSGIDPTRESTPVNDTQALPIQGPSYQTSMQNPRLPGQPPALPPRIPPQQAHPVAPVYQSGHGVPNPIQPLSCPDQTRARPAQYHLDALSKDVKRVFLQVFFDPGSLHMGFQACFDRYFVHVGPYCLSIESDRNSGAPFGSLSILELEKGFNAMLAGCFNATVLLRDGWIKVVVTAIAENGTGSNEVQRFTNEGWMGWRQLEDREAEILAAQLEDTHITQAL